MIPDIVQAIYIHNKKRQVREFNSVEIAKAFTFEFSARDEDYREQRRAAGCGGHDAGYKKKKKEDHLQVETLLPIGRKSRLLRIIIN